jgi:hypothetical protein
MGILLKLITFLPSIIDLVEKLLGPKTGKEKLGLAQNLVNTALAGVEGLTGKEIVDNAMWEEGQKQAIEGIVKCLNASVWAKKPK